MTHSSMPAFVDDLGVMASKVYVIGGDGVLYLSPIQAFST